LRILTLANHLGPRGGLERNQLAICRALAKQGHQVDVLYVSAGDFTDDWHRFTGAMIPMMGSLPRRQAPVRSVRGMLTAVRAGVASHPDVVYVYRYWDVPLAVAIGALAGAPVVFHLCLPPPASVPWWLRSALGRVAATLAVSADTAQRWRGLGLRPDRVRVVPTGIDTHQFCEATNAVRLATRRELGLDAAAFMVLFAGRISREKGIDVLLRAAGEAVADVPDMRVVIVGGPSLGADPEDSDRYAAELRNLAEGIPVTWLDLIPDVRPLLQAADVAVVPSLWPEPFARAVMEPLACGTPVVASRVGGTPEILTEWLADYLVEPGDPTVLAERLVALSSWRTDHPDLGSRCRQAAVNHLSLDREVDAVQVAFGSAIAVRHRHHGAIGDPRTP